MRMIRMMVGLAAAVCALGVLSSPALALKEPAVFGKFKASTPAGPLSGPVHGIGEAGEMTLGPYKFEECEQELRAKGNATGGETETLPLEVKFKKCVTDRSLGGGLKEPVLVSFTLNMEFHSNNSVKLGPSTVTLKATKSSCEVTIPPQWVPAGAETKGDFHEFEAVSYKTEKEKQTGPGIKKFGEFRERLAIEWELKGIEARAKVTPNCLYEGGKENPVTHEVEYNSGKMEGELEELTLKGGNLGFVPKI